VSLEIIAAVGGGAFVLTSFVTGLRLLWLSRTTRQLPEFVLGLGLFLMGGLGYPVMMVAELGSFLPDVARAGLVALNQLFGMVGLALVGTFTWRVFRPDDPRARTAMYVFAVGFVGAFAWRAAFGSFAPIALGGDQTPLAHTGLTLATLGWSGAESFRYYLQLRKRLRLGLADPLLTDRFRLWASSMFLAMLLSGISSVCNHLGIAFNTSTIGVLTVGVLGSLCSFSVWFAFFPPRFYASWVRGRAASGPAAA